MNRRAFHWLIAALVPVALIAQFGLESGQLGESAFMPGDSSHGHYQIELQCSACHDPDMGVRQDSCLECHESELERANDSHPIAKFTDPRNADRLAVLDARKCVTCHQEHQPELTGEMGLTLPTDYCYFCHQDIAQELPDHEGFPFSSCSTTGCHNYHDNSALYENFLLKHIDEPNIAASPAVPQRSHYNAWAAERGREPLDGGDRDAPSDVAFSQDLAYEWAQSSHARSGVNCTDCHASDTQEWTDSPGLAACQTCHAYEAETFLQSRHGMRLGQGLSPMTPAEARLPMKSGAAHQQLSCVACHDDHQFDTRRAAVDACMRCHDDGHTQAYKQSPHFQLWLSELNGSGPPGSGVSCATCHLPRVEENHAGAVAVRVLHNQNDTLRPVEKMIRPVCLECHGLGFAIDAQADQSLLDRNYNGLPADHTRSLDMVIEKARKLATDSSVTE